MSKEIRMLKALVIEKDEQLERLREIVDRPEHRTNQMPWNPHTGHNDHDEGQEPL